MTARRRDFARLAAAARRIPLVALALAMAGPLAATEGRGDRAERRRHRADRADARERKAERAEASDLGQAPRAKGTAGSQVESFEHAWTRVRDTYPYADMKGVDWTAVHDELLPRAQAARTAAQLRPVLADMFAKLGESHFQVIPQEAYQTLERIADSGAEDAGEPEARRGGGGDLGLDLRVRDGRALVTRVDEGGPADAAGVHPGWLLTAINGRDIEPLLAEVAASLDDAKLARLQGDLALRSAASGAPGSVATLELVHGGGRKATVELERRDPPGEPVTLGHLPEIVTQVESKMLPGDVGYVRFNIFLAPVAEPFRQAIVDFVENDARGVIVDLRGNPGGLGGMVMGMAGHFIDEPGKSLGHMKLRGAELDFVANPRLEMFDGPVAVLVDELSLSTSELFAAGMKATGRARVLGTKSSGMALPSLIEQLPNGDRMQFAFADLTDPAGRRIEGEGVEPHEVVELSRESLLQGRDDVIEAALAWIAQQSATRRSPDVHQSSAGARGLP